MSRRSTRLLQDIAERLVRLEHKADLMHTVLIVKEPNTPLAAEAYEGLRKQVVAAAAERRSHLAQVVAMAVAARRATTVSDLEAQVREWMAQAGIEEVNAVPHGAHPQDLFEDLDREGLAGVVAFDVVEPAYVDTHTGVVIRLGRARRSAAGPPPRTPVAGPAGDGVPPAEREPASGDRIISEEST